jgi:protein-disulfide isomerase
MFPLVCREFTDGGGPQKSSFREKNMLTLWLGGKQFAVSRSARRVPLILACAAAFGVTAVWGPRGFAETQPRVVEFQGIRSGLNPADWPILGAPNAPTVLLELFDYTCGGCQQMGQRVHAARQKYGADLAIIVLPVSLQGQNHEKSKQLARLALSVFVADREKFAGFHEWLLGGRSVDEASRHASELVGIQQLESALKSDRVQKYMQVAEQVYTKANRGTLPLLTSDRFTSRGLMQTDQQLFQTIEQYHGRQRVSPKTLAMGN